MGEREEDVAMAGFQDGHRPSRCPLKHVPFASPPIPGVPARDSTSAEGGAFRYSAGDIPDYLPQASEL